MHAKTVTIGVVAVAIIGLLLMAHYFDVAGMMRQIHGG
jgi:hypothetical protein